MESSFAFFILFSLILFATSTIDARKDSGEYWQGIMKDQPMPEAIQGLVYKDSVLPLSNKKTDCHSPSEARNNDHIVKHSQKSSHLLRTLNPNQVPVSTAMMLSSQLLLRTLNQNQVPVSTARDDAKLTEEKSFVKDSEPRPNVSVYHDADLKEDKSFVKDFEPRPNLSVYHDDAGPKVEKSFVKDFEPRPNASVYHE